eukprot:CAMPEP_0175092606 /NCGR_PEP_ID=MMETSP0086_2-20121207/2554_1 /TAXON_ID=136419 /ORGANISM="Unknown Unknown, Strain D1" /LENGTH=273 /DNA_ID=CAMNT_0016365483 /DNA_START=21 /DNA_END=842 /DNA_ORIENTATION=-
MASLASVIEMLVKNEASLKKAEFGGYGVELSASQCEEIAKGIATNTNCQEIDMANCGVESESGQKIVDALRSNSTLKKFDLGYNKINGDVIADLADALANNCTLEEVKIHRQSTDYGAGNEAKIAQLWDKNTTLTRLYCTMHDRRCNQTCTAGEVRNKEISRRKASGKDWIDLDPARRDEYAAMMKEKRLKEEEESKAANAPISEKVASTGGPYTYKQLTCAAEFRPDDVDVKDRPKYLSDDDFKEVFGMERADYDKLPNWKKLGEKKKHNLH